MSIQLHQCDQSTKRPIATLCADLEPARITSNRNLSQQQGQFYFSYLQHVQSCLQNLVWSEIQLLTLIIYLMINQLSNRLSRRCIAICGEKRGLPSLCGRSESSWHILRGIQQHFRVILLTSGKKIHIPEVHP